MYSPDEQNPYAPYRDQLLAHARQALIHGVRNGYPPKVDLAGVDDLLREERATFVTLEKQGRLRGCIGRLEACRPLYVDIAENAVAAALDDHRFPPVSEGEIPGISIAISILTPPMRLDIDSEAELIANLEPGRDGLILQEGRRRATFLPSVWEELPTPLDFIRHLKMKAGLPPQHWSDRMQAFVYQACYLADPTDASETT